MKLFFKNLLLLSCIIGNLKVMAIMPSSDSALAQYLCRSRDTLVTLGKTVAQTAGITGALCGLLFLKRVYDFYNIDSWLTNSIQNTFKKPTDFRFSAWQINEYNTAKSISESPTDIIKALKQDASLDDKIHIFNENNQRIKNPELGQLRTALNKEFTETKETLCYLSRYTNMPAIIIYLAHTERRFAKKVGEEKKDTNEKLELYLKDFQRIDLTELNDNINQAALSTPFSSYERYFRYFIHRPLVLYDNGEYYRSWNPLRWSLMPYKTKACELYFTVFQRLLRLHALKEIVDSKDASSIFEEKVRYTSKQLIDVNLTVKE